MKITKKNGAFKTAQFTARAARALSSNSLWAIAMLRLKQSCAPSEVTNG